MLRRVRARRRTRPPYAGSGRLPSPACRRSKSLYCSRAARQPNSIWGMDRSAFWFCATPSLRRMPLSTALTIACDAGESMPASWWYTAIAATRRMMVAGRLGQFADVVGNGARGRRQPLFRRARSSTSANEVISALFMVVITESYRYHLTGVNRGPALTCGRLVDART
jgi:hypothetical protein